MAKSAQHTADGILDTLVIDLLNGRWAPGEALPSERVLAEAHDTSRIIVRQAIHRAADLGLVEVGQGRPAVVLDPDGADLRVLTYVLKARDRLTARGKALLEHFVEYRNLYGLSLLDTAHRRATDEERRGLLALVKACPMMPSRKRINRLEAEFWAEITRVGRNRIFAMEMRWWAELDLDPLDDEEAPAALRWFYRELARQLVAHVDPLPYYLATLRTRFSDQV